MSGRGRKKRNKLAIYLLKDDRVTDGKFLLDAGLEKTELDDGVVVYKVQIPNNEPSWQREFLQNKVEEFYKSGTGAIVKVPVEIDGEAKTFLLTFGYGFSKVNGGACEEQFGIRTALNIGDTEQIRAINRKTISATPKISLEQLAKLEAFSSFGVDVEQDMMQSIVLASKKPDEYGRTIVGGSSLHVSSPKTVSDIKDLLPEIYKAYKSDTYKKNGYGWVDNISPVKDKDQIALLDASLLDAFNGYTDDDKKGLTASPPDLIDWEDVMGFSSSGRSNADINDEIDITAYNSEEDLNDIEQLKGKNVFLWKNSSDSAIDQWALYKCLNFEVEIGGAHFLLSNGKWYEISKDYATDVDSWYENLSKTDSTLPEYSKVTKDGKNVHSEGAYNATCVGYECLDRNLVSLGNNKKIEACDLYKDKNFIHVKIFDGSSAPISHLLSQAAISAKLFISDENFREKLNEKLTTKLEVGQIANPTRTEYTITLGIITNKDSLELPFFSKINLRSMITQLNLMGLENVKIERIKGNW